jgi:hypothetical protein
LSLYEGLDYLVRVLLAPIAVEPLPVRPIRQ